MYLVYLIIYTIVDSVESLGDIIRYGDDCDLYTILR